VPLTEINQSLTNDWEDHLAAMVTKRCYVWKCWLNLWRCQHQAYKVHHRLYVDLLYIWIATWIVTIDKTL